MRGLVALILLGGMVAMTPALTPMELKSDDADLAPISWLAGSWVCDQGPQRTEEHWTHATAGGMYGVSRTIKGGKTMFFEYFRIEKTADGLVYFASPKGRDPATPFKMKESSEGRVVFENPEHDFPQRIIYTKQADGSVIARIEGTSKGKERDSEWHYKPAIVN